MPTGDEPIFEISGGQETVTTGGYKYVAFTSSGTLTVQASGSVDVLSCGAGAAGSIGICGGGGGAGELDYWTTCSLTENVTVTIGAGGDSNTGEKGESGGNTSFGGFVTSLGGGGGSGTNTSGNTGGSGGGGAGYYNTGPGGASGANTNVGGSGSGYLFDSGWAGAGGGGGGANAAGSAGSYVHPTTNGTGGAGGAGKTLSVIDANLTSANFPTVFSGSMTVICSGGGGSAGAERGGATGTGNLGGTGAGNGGGEAAGTVSNATSYGSGGGGMWDGGGTFGNGKSGLVIVRQAV